MTSAALFPVTVGSTGEVRETKSGCFIYDGTPSLFHEWEFRTMARYNAASEEDRAKLGSRILEGLRGDAFMIACDMGQEALGKADAIPKLIELIRNSVYPFQEVEAAALYKVGQKKKGPLARANGESMVSYIRRRKRWWELLKKLDDKSEISEIIRANLLLELSGLN